MTNNLTNKELKTISKLIGFSVQDSNQINPSDIHSLKEKLKVIESQEKVQTDTFLNNIKAQLKTKQANNYIIGHLADPVSKTIKAFCNTEKERMFNIQDDKSSMKIFHYNTIKEQNNKILEEETYSEKKTVSVPDTPIKLSTAKHSKSKKANYSTLNNSSKRLLGSKRGKNTINKNNEDDVYCVEDCEFSRKDCNQRMIFCEGECGIWYHLQCIGMTEEEMNEYENKNWYCKDCLK